MNVEGLERTVETGSVDEMQLTPLQQVRAKLEEAPDPKSDVLTEEDMALLPEDEQKRVLKARDKRARRALRAVKAQTESKPSPKRKGKK